MNLENYVCTLEQSKKLDALLGKRESIFVWFQDCGSGDYIRRYDSIVLEGYKQVNAYTSQELGEIIGEHLKCNWTQCVMVEHKYAGHIFYKGVGLNTNNWASVIDAEAHARAEFLIYLLEHK